MRWSNPLELIAKGDWLVNLCSRVLRVVKVYAKIACSKVMLRGRHEIVVHRNFQFQDYQGGFLLCVVTWILWLFTGMLSARILPALDHVDLLVEGKNRDCMKVLSRRRMSRATVGCSQIQSTVRQRLVACLYHLPCGIRLAKFANSDKHTYWVVRRAKGGWIPHNSSGSERKQ